MKTRDLEQGGGWVVDGRARVNVKMTESDYFCWRRWSCWSYCHSYSCCCCCTMMTGTSCKQQSQFANIMSLKMSLLLNTKQISSCIFLLCLILESPFTKCSGNKWNQTCSCWSLILTCMLHLSSDMVYSPRIIDYINTRWWVLKIGIQYDTNKMGIQRGKECFLLRLYILLNLSLSLNLQSHNEIRNLLWLNLQPCER